MKPHTVICSCNPSYWRGWWRRSTKFKACLCIVSSIARLSSEVNTQAGAIIQWVEVLAASLMTLIPWSPHTCSSCTPARWAAETRTLEGHQLSWSSQQQQKQEPYLSQAEGESPLLKAVFWLHTHARAFMRKCSDMDTLMIMRANE